MKKLIFLSLLAFATMQAAHAQLKAVAPFASETTGSTLDTLVNTTGKKQQLKVTMSANAVYIQSTATKISGNPAGSYIRLFGSQDGVAWKRIMATGSLSAADSLVLANVATPQPIFFKDSPSQYLFYRIDVTGVGTATTQIRSTAVSDQK